MSVLIEGDKIKQIGTTIDAPKTATVIDAGGRVMTPGFIDSHSHLMFQLSFGEAFSSDESQTMKYVLQLKLRRIGIPTLQRMSTTLTVFAVRWKMASSASNTAT